MSTKIICIDGSIINLKNEKLRTLVPALFETPASLIVLCIPYYILIEQSFLSKSLFLNGEVLDSCLGSYIDNITISLKGM